MKILGRIAYHFSLIQPVLPTYLHLIISALLPIYAGAHASLSRPSSAAKPSKRGDHVEDDSGDDETEESQQKMEGLSPGDAIMFPLLAGFTLTGLYFIIKWLQDPALLNKILNWYFSVFGVLSVARLLTDGMGVLHSYTFPDKYMWDGRIWEVQPQLRKAESLPDRSTQISSPLPGLLSRLPLPARLHHILWTIRCFPSQKLIISVYFRKQGYSRFRLGPQGAFGLSIACAAVLYYNLVKKTWWLTNILAFGFAYSTLQLMSPTTFWTGTLILSSLFFYDIYFVFFTPLMVTVATKLEIPAKLLFPRPPGPDEDPGKQALSMLGLGDVVLPGIMIGLALRFDLYLFYLRKQRRKSALEGTDKLVELDMAHLPESEIIKAKWQPATGSWGERFWGGQAKTNIQIQQHGGGFPKTYFHSSLVGYVTGMICTLSVMHIYGHAQPALLYLVPAVLGSLWGTALIRGDLKTMWEFSEAEDEDSAEDKKGKGVDKGNLIPLPKKQKMAKSLDNIIEEEREENGGTRAKETENKGEKKKIKESASHRDRTNELFSFSIALPQTSFNRKPLGNSVASVDQYSLQPDKGNTTSNTKSPSVEHELRQASANMLDEDSKASSGELRRRRVPGERIGAGGEEEEGVRT